MRRKNIIVDEEKAEHVLHEIEILKQYPAVHSAGRIISGESGDSTLSAIVATKNGGSAEAVSCDLNRTPIYPHLM
jgi:hypothetical protein